MRGSVAFSATKGRWCDPLGSMRRQMAVNAIGSHFLHSGGVEFRVYIDANLNTKSNGILQVSMIAGWKIDDK